MSKQTSIEWLVEQISYKMDIRIEDTTIGCDLFEQAKAMHKEEVINAVVWFDDTDRRPHEIEIEVKKYYNETFGSDNEN